MELAVFIVAGLIVVLGGVGVVTSRNPVHAALSLVATLFGIAVLFLNQNAQLLAVVQVIVYTGAIVVLILFVLMLLGVDEAEDIEVEPLVGQRLTAALAALAMVGLIAAVFLIGNTRVVTGQQNCVDVRDTAASPYEAACEAIDPSRAVVSEDTNIAAIGRLLFTDYVFAFEATAALLTVAVVGAVLLARRPGDLAPVPDLDADEPDDEEVVS